MPKAIPPFQGINMDGKPLNTTAPSRPSQKMIDVVLREGEAERKFASKGAGVDGTAIVFLDYYRWAEDKLNRPASPQQAPVRSAEADQILAELQRVAQRLPLRVLAGDAAHKLATLVAQPSAPVPMDACATADQATCSATAHSPVNTAQPVTLNPALVEFAKWIIREGPWQGGMPDGGAVQDKAVELGLLMKCTADESNTTEWLDIDGVDELGDTYYVLAPSLTGAPLTQPVTGPSAPADRFDDIACFVKDRIAAGDISKDHGRVILKWCEKENSNA